MDIRPDLILGAAGGGGVVAAVAKWAIEKALADLGKLTSATNELQTKIAEISVRLEKLAEHDTVLKDLTAKVYEMSAIHDDRPNRARR